MKSLVPLICLLAASFGAVSAPAAEKKPYVMYAEFVVNAEVNLSDGSRWLMDKGDCFPIHMFKEQQTKVILQLAGATFMTPAYNVRVLKDSEAKRGLESYRKMLDTYLKTQAERWKNEVKE